MDTKNLKTVIETVKAMYTPKQVSENKEVKEASMMKDDGKVVHNCAKHVEHAEWGQGNCIAEEHADPDRYGNIAWYDIEFPHGIEKGVPISELKVLQSEMHMHSKAKKKVAEALEGDNSRNTENDKEKEKALEAVKAAANNTLPNEATPGTVAGAKVGGEKEAVKQGVKEETEEVNELSKAYLQMKKYQKKKMAEEENDEDEEDEEDEEDKKDKKEVDETIIYSPLTFEIQEADKGYDAYFRAYMKKHGISSVADFKTPEEKKAFFNKVDAGYKAQNEEVFLEAMMSKEMLDKISSHEKAGHKVSDKQSKMKNGEMEYSFVVSRPDGKKSRHIYHGSSTKVQSMQGA